MQRNVLIVAVVLVVGAIALLTAATLPPEAEADRLYQVSTIDSLMRGDFDGSMTIGNLERKGDTGIGTFHRLDGEMVMLEGVTWQARADGSVSRAPPDETTPFASVGRFRADRTGSLDPVPNLSVAGERLDAHLANIGLFAMVRVDGVFDYVKVRAPPAQEEPYPNLTTAVAGQQVYEHRNITGTLVGLYSPAFSNGVSVPGWHLHFVSADRTAGGHVLDLASDGTAQVAIDDLPSLTVVLPPWAPPAASATVEISSDLAAVEKGR